MDRPVLVGTDGSAGAMAAARWAAAEAAQRRRPLLVVQGFHWPFPTVVPIRLPTDVFAERPARQLAEHQLRSVVDRCRREQPGLAVHGRLCDGPSASVLTELSAFAELLVIGSSGLGAVTRTLVGSTAAKVMRTARCPLVVVPNPGRGDEQGRRVVLGMDGSAASHHAAGFAFDFARRHELEVHAVHALADEALGPALTAALRGGQADPLRTNARLAFAALLSSWHCRYPELPVRCHAVPDRPSQALLRFAEEDTVLLVVGGTGRGRVRRMVLGSVSHAVLHHSPVPVALLNA